MNQNKTDTANTILQFGVATGLLSLVFFCVACVAKGSIKADSAVVGSAFTLLVVLVNFCFPNSIGSQKQTDTISRLSDAVATPSIKTTTETLSGGQDNVSSRANPASNSSSRGGDQDPSGSAGQPSAAGAAVGTGVSAATDSRQPSAFPASPPPISPDGLGEAT